MKLLALLSLLSLLIGCSATPWKETGQPGPWCAPSMQAHVFYRTVDSFGAPNPQGRMALAGKSGVMTSEFSFHHQLDAYFGMCRFIDQWPTHGTVDSIPSHELPFDLCLVSMNPTVIVGAERQNPKVSSFWPLDKSEFTSIGSTFLIDPIAVRPTIPFHPGAKVIWFSPAVDNDLHQLDLTSGTASFAIGKNEQIVVVVVGSQLTTSRK
jgi:hypothetical protein